MRRGIVWALLGSVMVLTGCETTQPRQFAPPTDYVPLDNLRIESRFNIVNVTPLNIGDEANKCVPQLNATSKSVQQLAAKLPLPAGTATGLGHASSAHQFLVRASSAMCLRQSEARHLILAADALVDTINPVGVPPDVLEDWNRQIALKMAQAGTVKVLYAFAGGGASAATYWFGTGQYDNTTLYYSQEFKKAGAWEPSAYGLVFQHSNMASISETKRNGVGRKGDFFPVRR
ncbi:hypothetical protein [uncultured Rhodoferax sp.]|uniref:hypothetical protein n=1 Tax=uncultured Rhodoferax sp. TaxID=223188 RepID=UPI0025F95C03|nr:hypothetical protein [uncultured Rhodoferax sp.]